METGISQNTKELFVLEEIITAADHDLLHTGDLVTKLQQVGACVCVGEPNAHRGLQEHEVGLCGSFIFLLAN